VRIRIDGLNRYSRDVPDCLASLAMARFDRIAALAMTVLQTANKNPDIAAGVLHSS
jgi:hypothetical protein